MVHFMTNRPPKDTNGVTLLSNSVFRGSWGVNFEKKCNEESKSASKQGFMVNW